MTLEEFIAKRFSDFVAGDFGAIWDSYHPDSNFRRAFPDRDAYRAYGAAELSGNFVFETCRILLQNTVGQRARVMLLNRFADGGDRYVFFEYANLVSIDGEWRYFSGARLERDKFEGIAEEISWEKFKELSDGVFF